MSKLFQQDSYTAATPEEERHRQLMKRLENPDLNHQYRNEKHTSPPPAAVVEKEQEGGESCLWWFSLPCCFTA